MIIILSISRDV